jgi:hypothetical protein
MYAEISLQRKNSVAAVPAGGRTFRTILPQNESALDGRKKVRWPRFELRFVDNVPVARGANASSYRGLDAAWGRKGAGR